MALCLPCEPQSGPGGSSMTPSLLPQGGFPMNGTLAIFVITFVLLAVACQGETVIVEVPAHTPTPQPTYTPLPTLEPLPTHTPLATYTPYPTSTAYPTQTPLPTYTPYPTYTPVPPPTATPTPRPTFTPAPTATRRPTNTTRPSGGWENTGYWYRDRESENVLNDWIKAEGYTSEAQVATLDAPPSSFLNEISLTLGCIGSVQFSYLTPYDSIPPGTDVYYIGIWNHTAGEWKGQHYRYYYNPVLTDDGYSIYISNQGQIRQILAILRTAGQLRSQNEVLSAGMFEDVDGGSHLISNFDVAGVQDALDYLPCF